MTRDLAEPVGQVRSEELQLVRLGVAAQPEHRLEEQERGARGPGLRRAGDRIRDRHRGLLAVEPAEQLRQPELAEVLGRLEDLADEPVRLVLEAVALQPGGGQRRVVRPDGARVVAERVVARLALGVGPDPPAREHRRAEQPVGDVASPGLGDDPAPQALAGVRPDRVGLALVGVEGHRVVALVLDPERLLEACPEGLGVAHEPIGEVDVAAHPGEGRHPRLGVEHVALDLGEGDRRPSPRGRSGRGSRRPSPSSPG